MKAIKIMDVQKETQRILQLTTELKDEEDPISVVGGGRRTGDPGLAGDSLWPGTRGNHLELF